MKDIILNDRKYGYRFSDKIEVRIGNDTQSVLDDTQNDPQLDLKNDGWNSRQQWILTQLAKGIPLQNRRLQKQFKITATTVKRDLTPRGNGVWSNLGDQANWFERALNSSNILQIFKIWCSGRVE